MASPYDVLGVGEDADAEEIDRAYRRRVIETHPDQGGSARELRTVREAYEEIRVRNAADGPPDAGDTDPSPADADATGPAGERTDTPEGEPTDAGGGRTRPAGARVEYLNYEVLDDHGWDLGDEDLFERAAEADLDPADHGTLLVDPGESLLGAAEDRGFAWPYACRGGACANCAVAVVEGEMEMFGDHILRSGMLEGGIRLSCLGAPVTGDARVVYNVKHLPGLDELRLPADRFERAQADD